MVIRKKYWMLLGCLWTALSACAPSEDSTPEKSADASSTTEDADSANDPFEPANRAIFAFNRVLDKGILRPLSLIYRDTLPNKVQESVTNAIHNFQEPVTLANDVLQGKGERAAQTTARFLINSTVGIGGLFDVAKTMDIPHHKEDLGQTLAVWGVESGPYLMLPVLGPSSPRDLTGTVGDLFLDPANYVFHNNDINQVGWAIKGVDVTQKRASLVDLSDQLEEESVDFYAAIRSIYFQKRRSDVVDGAQTLEDTFEGELYDFSAK